MLETYILPILIFAGIGLIAGILLTVVSKVFEVKVDERLEQIGSVLPQINCGACGFSGCADYANGVMNGAATNLCKPGGDETSQKISEILGVEFKDVIEQVAVVRCQGSCERTSTKYVYDGIKSCAAASLLYSGNEDCHFGCMGIGDCAKVCPVDAIEIKNELASVDIEKCIGCGLCVAECPKNLITIRNATNHVDVKCMSNQGGKDTKAICTIGCIGCKICEKKCLVDAIHVENNLASIDYSKCTNCGACYEACPTGAISNCEKF